LNVTVLDTPGAFLCYAAATSVDLHITTCLRGESGRQTFRLAIVFVDHK